MCLDSTSTLNMDVSISCTHVPAAAHAELCKAGLRRVKMLPRESDEKLECSRKMSSGRSGIQFLIEARQTCKLLATTLQRVSGLQGSCGLGSVSQWIYSMLSLSASCS